MATTRDKVGSTLPQDNAEKGGPICKRGSASKRDRTRDPTLCRRGRSKMSELKVAMAEGWTRLRPKKISGKVGVGRNLRKAANF